MMRAAGLRRWRRQLLLARSYSSSEGLSAWQQQHAAWQSNVAAEAVQQQQLQQGSSQFPQGDAPTQHFVQGNLPSVQFVQSSTGIPSSPQFVQGHHNVGREPGQFDGLATGQGNGVQHQGIQGNPVGQHWNQQDGGNPQFLQGSSGAPPSPQFVQWNPSIGREPGQFAGFAPGQGNGVPHQGIQGNPAGQLWNQQAGGNPQTLQGSSGASPSPQFVKLNPNIGQVPDQFAGFAPGQGNGVPQQGIQGNLGSQHWNQQGGRNAPPSTWNDASHQGSYPASSSPIGEFASPSNAAAHVRHDAGYDTSSSLPMGKRAGPVQQQQQQPVFSGVGTASATSFGGGNSAQRSPSSGGGNGQPWFSRGPSTSGGGGSLPFRQRNQETRLRTRPTAGGHQEIQTRQSPPVSQVSAYENAGHFSASFLSDSVSGDVAGPKPPAYNPIPGISARPHQSGKGASPLIQDIVKGLTRSATDSVQGSELGPLRQPQVPEKKVVARLSVLPKFALKSDIMSYFSNCNLEEQDLTFIYDDKYRARFMQIEFKNQDLYKTALKTLSDKGRLGGRFMKLELDSEFEMDEINNVVQTFNSHVLLMDNLPKQFGPEDLDKFFHGYDLGSQGVRILRSRVVPWSRGLPERQAAAHFDTYLKASRALREKQGEFCGDKPVELRYLQP